MSGVDLIRFYESPVNGKSTGMAAVRFHTSSAAEKCADEFRLYKDSYGEYATKVTRLALEDVRKFEETGVLPQEFLAGAVALPPAAVGGLPVPGHSTEAQAAAVKQALMSSGSAVTANIFAAAGLMAPSAPAQQQQQQPQQQQQQQARALAEALSKLQSANPQQSQAATIAGLRSNLEQLIQQRQHLQQPGGYGAPPPMPQQPMFNPNDGMQGMDFFAAAAKRQLTEAYTPDAKRINRIN
ncbi:hypothetical protein DIPPA_21796 [Diplonema papillatum]|nr:hypothetical protein DIPPA_21796 [Diplonema papillatum]